MISTKNQSLINYGAASRAFNPLTANTASVVITPAANVNGVIIHAAKWASLNAGAQIALIAATVAPTSLIGTMDVLAIGLAYTSGATVVLGLNMERDIKVPAGMGVYFFTVAAENAAGSFRNLVYTLL